MRYSRLVHISQQIRKTLTQNPTFTSSSSSSILTSHAAPNCQSHLQSCSRSFSTASQEPSNPAAAQWSENASAAITDELAGLTLLEVMDLVEVMQKKRGGINELPLMMLMTPGMGIGGLKKGALKRGGGGGAGGGAEEEKKAEKTAFDVKLDVFDAASKIKVIKEVRAFTSLGLKEAKDLVEKAPTLLKKGVTKEEAETIIAKMKEVGAKVSME